MIDPYTGTAALLANLGNDSQLQDAMVQRIESYFRMSCITNTCARAGHVVFVTHPLCVNVVRHLTGCFFDRTTELTKCRNLNYF